MSNAFAIGVYQSSNGLVYQGGFDIGQPSSIQPPFAGTYGGTYTLTFYDTIAQPRGVHHTPPPNLGKDIGGFPTVKGFAAMEWTYPFLRSDEWYKLYALYRYSLRPSGIYTGRVYIQWPDPQSGTVVQASARWDGITDASRDMPTFTNIKLLFSQIGVDNTSVTGTWLAPS